MTPTPRAIAVIRIGLGTATIFNALEMWVMSTKVAEGALALPVAGWMPTPTELATTIWLSIAVAAGCGLVGGPLMRPAAALSTACSGWMFLWDHQAYSSHRWLAFLLVAVLVFAKSGRSWPWFLMMTQISVVYTFAGLSKINSEFLSGDPFHAWLRWDLPDPLTMVIAVSTVVTELFIGVSLWLARLRRTAILAGVLLHVSIVTMMADLTLPLIAFALTCVPIYWLFLELLPAPKPTRVVVWDAHCSFCRRWAAVLRRLDLLGFHTFVSSSDPTAVADSRITIEDTDRAIQLLTPSSRHEGFDAVRRILLASPVTTAAAPLLWLPGAKATGDRAYGRVASHRTCRVDLGPHDGSVREDAGRSL